MQTSRSKITRQDRAVEDDGWIEALLARAPVGTLATAVDVQPFQVTLLFVYDPGRRAIYLHKARRGQVWENLQRNPRACFTVAEMGRLLPASTALNFSVEYCSVVVFASAVLVEEPTEAEHVLQMLLDKYFPHLHPGQDYRPITAEERDVTAVYRLEIEEWSGKRKLPQRAFQGRFYMGINQMNDKGQVIQMLKEGKYAWIGGAPLAAVPHGSYMHHHEEHLEPLLAWLEEHQAGKAG